MIEFQKAEEELNVAEQNFNFVDPEYFEVANMALTAAILKYNQAYKKLKLLVTEAPDNFHEVYFIKENNHKIRFHKLIKMPLWLLKDEPIKHQVD
jgi:hypothetical protein